MKYERVDTSKINEIFSLYRQDLSLAEIERITKIPMHSIHYQIYEANQNVDRSKVSLDQKNRINILTNFGYKPKEIAEDLGLKLKIVNHEIRQLKKQNKITIQVND